MKLLDEFKVVEEVPASRVKPGCKWVDTTWDVTYRAGKLKCRWVAREFKSLESREDLFAPGSTTSTARLVDILSLKDERVVSKGLVVS